MSLGQANGTFLGTISATGDYDIESGWGSEGYEREVADVNGDGHADIIGFGYGATYVSLGTSNGTFETGFVATNQFSEVHGGWSAEDLERRVFDVNNDGRADIVGFGHAETYIALGQSDGTFSTAEVATQEFVSAAGWGHEGYERRIGDVNGDGIADIIGFGHSDTYVSLGTTADEFILV